MVTFAACQYAFSLFDDFAAYAAHLDALAGEAAGNGAQLLLLPEYAAMALTGLLPEDARGDLGRSIAGIQPLIPDWLALCEDIARRRGVHFCPGSAPVLDADGRYRNRAFLFGPEGRIGHQDKIIMTRFEREQWFIAGGVEGLRTFDTPHGRLGILICYDNEFPMLARRLAEMGADLVLAPSCTDTEAGYHRVRIGAQARALENQFAVLVSPTAGKAPWSPAVDENHGRAALYVPADHGMPPDGVFASSEAVFTETSRWLHGAIDLARVRELRHKGQVALFRDWPEQFDVHPAAR
ncbi:MAG: carbon-nitrogen hydrolase family protein [Pseudochelatococcus sp.]|jgi:predicted amidohydrolase|uniref:carbon-nitrogen hydrolase family protein n=1 Tax=Pseudochelatococcus sp. TaxID=2020869 RepID=UPI003D8AFFA6